MQTQRRTTVTPPEWHDRFVDMLPQIEDYARRAFRKCHRELRDELVASVVADCYLAYARLVELDREHDAFPTVLADFSVRRIGSDICVGTSRNQYDVSSRYGQLRTGAQVQSLHWQDRDGDWDELVVEDRRQSCPAQTAALRVDLHEWLAKLTPRNLKIAVLLAAGERACDVAKVFSLTVGRISQIRKALAESWRDFHGIDPGDPEFTWLGCCEAA